MSTTPSHPMADESPPLGSLLVVPHVRLLQWSRWRVFAFGVSPVRHVLTAVCLLAAGVSCGFGGVAFVAAACCLFLGAFALLLHWGSAQELAAARAAEFDGRMRRWRKGYTPLITNLSRCTPEELATNVIRCVPGTQRSLTAARKLSAPPLESRVQGTRLEDATGFAATYNGFARDLIQLHWRVRTLATVCTWAAVARREYTNLEPKIRKWLREHHRVNPSFRVFMERLADMAHEIDGKGAAARLRKRRELLAERRELARQRKAICANPCRQRWEPPAQVLVRSQYETAALVSRNEELEQQHRLDSLRERIEQQIGGLENARLDFLERGELYHAAIVGHRVRELKEAMSASRYA